MPRMEQRRHSVVPRRAGLGRSRTSTSAGMRHTREEPGVPADAFTGCQRAACEVVAAEGTLRTPSACCTGSPDDPQGSQAALAVAGQQQRLMWTPRA